jgi:hypothetical protein
MSSFETALYYFGTLPDEALQQIQELLHQEAGWTKTSCPQEAQQPEAFVAWTMEAAPNDLLPEDELRDKGTVVKWFSSGTRKHVYHSHNKAACRTLRAKLKHLLASHHLPACIGDDYGSGNGDDAIQQPTRATRDVIGSIRAGQRMIFVRLP